MFKDVGKGIMRLAKIEGWTTFIFCVILAIYFLTDKGGYHSWSFYTDNDIYALYCIILGLCGFVSAWPLYGLGQIVDDVHAMRNKVSPEKEEKKEVKQEVVLPEL